MCKSYIGDAMDPDKWASEPWGDSLIILAYKRGLSVRHLVVFEYLAQGLSTEAIADKMGLTAKTVQHYTSAIYDGLGIPRDDPNVNMRVLVAKLWWQYARRQ